MGIPTNFISIIILCNKAFKHGCAAKFLIYFGTDAELLCVELHNCI
jgi:hypothetical protein